MSESKSGSEGKKPAGARRLVKIPVTPLPPKKIIKKASKKRKSR